MLKKTDAVLIDTGYDGPHRFSLDKRSQPHLGLAYIAAQAEKKGYRVRIIDRIVNSLNPDQIAEQIAEIKPDVVGITTSTIDRFLSIKILNALKKKDGSFLTVGGGPHFSSTAADALKCISSLDAVCVGEGEYTFCEVIEKYKERKNPDDLTGIQGLAFKTSSGEIVFNAERHLIEDLDELPFPAWHLFEMDKYIGKLATVPEYPHRAVGVGSSRGCPYSCAFCFNSLSKKVRFLSAARFVDTIEILVKEYGYKAFNFVDDSFTCNTGRVMEICSEIEKRNLQIEWYCSLNVNQTADNNEMLVAMKKAGCVALGFGVEYPNNKVLKAINKKSTTKIIRRAILNVRKLGFLSVFIFLMQGLPRQTACNTLTASLRTIYYRLLLRDSTISFGKFAQVYPGTKFEELSKKQGDLPVDFSWNSSYSSKTVEAYSNSPYLFIKMPTVPFFITQSVSIDTITRILDVMTTISHKINSFKAIKVKRIKFKTFFGRDNKNTSTSLPGILNEPPEIPPGMVNKKTGLVFAGNRIPESMVIFGTGALAKRMVPCIKQAQLNVECFFDNNAMNDNFDGFTVMKPEFIPGSTVIIASMFYSEIIPQLIDLGYK